MLLLLRKKLLQQIVELLSLGTEPSSRGGDSVQRAASTQHRALIATLLK